MAADNILTLTDDNFEAEVLRSPLPTLVDFWAVWCAPCRQIAPAVEALARELAGQVRVGKMDIDHNRHTPVRFDVRSIPTLLLFSEGKVVGQLVGAVPKAKIERFIKDQLAKGAKA